MLLISQFAVRFKTFKLRGIIHTAIECCANPLSLVVSLDWCVNTLLCHNDSGEGFMCFVCRTSSQKGGGKLCIFFFFLAIIALYAFGFLILLLGGQTVKHKKPLCTF